MKAPPANWSQKTGGPPKERDQGDIQRNQEEERNN